MTLGTKTVERKAKIIQAAAQLFAGQGYHGTTTRDIARIAEISENTLFRYFEHKEDIFWAALRSQLTSLKLRRDVLDAMAVGDSLEIVLPQIMTVMVDTVTLKPELLRLLAVSFLELRWKAEVVCREHLTPLFDAVKNYLALKIESGTLRNLDPGMLASAFAMTVIVHPALSRLIADGSSHSDRRGAIKAYTRFWLDILIPQPSDRGTLMSRLIESEEDDQNSMLKV